MTEWIMVLKQGDEVVWRYRSNLPLFRDIVSDVIKLLAKGDKHDYFIEIFPVDE